MGLQLFHDHIEINPIWWLQMFPGLLQVLQDSSATNNSRDLSYPRVPRLHYQQICKATTEAANLGVLLEQVPMLGIFSNRY